MRDQNYAVPFVYTTRPPPGRLHTHSFFDTLRTARMSWTPPVSSMLVKLSVLVELDIPKDHVLLLGTAYGTVAHTLSCDLSFSEPLVLGWYVDVRVASYETAMVFSAILMDPRGAATPINVWAKRVFDCEAPSLVHCCVVDALCYIEKRNSFLFEQALRALKACKSSESALEHYERHCTDKDVLNVLRQFCVLCN